jgi:hypothetical protein
MYSFSRFLSHLPILTSYIYTHIRTDRYPHQRRSVLLRTEHVYDPPARALCLPRGHRAVLFLARSLQPTKASVLYECDLDGVYVGSVVLSFFSSSFPSFVLAFLSLCPASNGSGWMILSRMNQPTFSADLGSWILDCGFRSCSQASSLNLMICMI